MKDRYVILTHYNDGAYSVLVKKKEFGDDGTYYSKTLDANKVSIFETREKANSAMYSIQKRRPHDYDFKVATFEEAETLLCKNGWCIVLVNPNRTLSYVQKDTTINNNEDNIMFFSTEDKANEFLENSTLPNKDMMMTVIFETL